MARPRKEIPEWQVYKLARIGCTNVEIATIVGCSDDTLVSHFSDILRKGREKMKMSLRRMQYRAACAGDRTILIWLGKQYLGQRDKQDLDVKITDERAPYESAINQYLADHPGATPEDAKAYCRQFPEMSDIDKVLASERVQ